MTEDDEQFTGIDPADDVRMTAKAIADEAIDRAAEAREAGLELLAYLLDCVVIEAHQVLAGGVPTPLPSAVKAP